jgi:hypothetical protein
MAAMCYTVARMRNLLFPRISGETIRPGVSKTLHPPRFLRMPLPERVVRRSYKTHAKKCKPKTEQKEFDRRKPLP